ncbi:hypothetical protein [Ulvibacter antarcticus]|uniref:Membrane or secreted protein n=1 Tax=Ulvibacter antarcticus TaxID=442714 RepID=A0A3L9Y8S3_9FLAO|nr:hypothetical protein [Ulvibacter antarcticus]RMA56764.1 hypothetical protein BXY75_3282 [Ulvibacter antarcticus]
MKTLVIILSAIGLLSLNSCKQETDPQVLMDNPETRTEVFNTITQNDDYMAEFMDNMQNDENAMQMMQGNKKMMGSMMQGEGMQMMMRDSTMMKQVMGNNQMMHSMMNGMMNDGKMMGTMMKMMHEKGMMSEGCMESCSKMMGEKGMDMQGMNKMDNMDTQTKDDHKEHH